MHDKKFELPAATDMGDADEMPVDQESLDRYLAKRQMEKMAEAQGEF